MKRINFEIDLHVASEGYDRQTCWVHARAGLVPPKDAVVMTMQKLRITGDDVFYALHELYSNDGGGLGVVLSNIAKHLAGRNLVMV